MWKEKANLLQVSANEHRTLWQRLALDGFFSEIAENELLKRESLKIIRAFDSMNSENFSQNLAEYFHLYVGQCCAKGLTTTRLRRHKSRLWIGLFVVTLKSSLSISMRAVCRQVCCWRGARVPNSTIGLSECEGISVFERVLGSTLRMEGLNEFFFRD